MPMAEVYVPAPQGLTEDVIGQAIHALNKLGTIESRGDDEGISVFTVPDDERPADKPAGVPLLRFVASVIPYLGR